MARAALAACCAGLVLSCAAFAQPAVGPEYDCLIEARQTLDIRSPVEGVIETVHVQRGASVKRGQTLAVLFSGPERAQLDLARSRATNEKLLADIEQGKFFKKERDAFSARIRTLDDEVQSRRGANARMRQRAEAKVEEEKGLRRAKPD